MRKLPLSVVVPCRNEASFIKSCVRSIINQDLEAHSFEILVIDGMSDDGTRQILDHLTTEDSRVRWINNPQCSTPCAMNIGIRESKGQYVAIMGAHNRYASDYLRLSLEVLYETGADNVGGAMICEAQSCLQLAICAAHHNFFSVGGASWHDPSYEGETETVFGGVYRREVFEKIGVFDEELIRNQDDEFNLRLKKAGGKIWQSPRIKSWYSPRATLKDLFCQFFDYGYWKVRVMQKHKWPSSFRHLVPGIFVFILGFLSMVSLLWPVVIWFWLAIVSLYVTANIFVSVYLSFRKNFKLVFLLPCVFACYHLGYGLGFLKGILDFFVFSSHRKDFPTTQRGS